MKKRIISIVLTLTLCLGLLPTAVLAADTGGFTVTGDSAGYSFSDGVLTVSDGADLTLSTTNQTTDRIVVANGATATITLDGVNIVTTDTNIPIDVPANSTLLLKLNDNTENTITAGGVATGPASPGIHVPKDATLIIQGEGGITVNGGTSISGLAGAGIGGKVVIEQTGYCPGEPCGTVIILSTGTIEISGGQNVDTSSSGNDIGGGKGPPNQDGDDGQGIRPVPGQANTYEVWGELTLPEGVTIPEGAILTGDGSFAEGSKLTQSAPASAPTVSDISQITDTSITLDGVTGGIGKAQYACVENRDGNTSPEEDDWQNHPTFENLIKSSAYTLYTRYYGDKFYQPSSSSDGLTVITAPSHNDVSINYAKETISFAPQNIEVSSDSNFSRLFHTDESITPHIARNLYVRAKVEEGTQAPIRGVTTVSLPPRPNYADGITAVNASAAGVSDGKITGVSANMEYKKVDAASWTDCAGNTIDNLTSGTYEVRTKATENSFASLSKKVTIGVGNIITITLPTFDPVHTGYTQPDPKPIEICNSSDEDATIVSVSCTGEIFNIQPEPTQDLLKIPANGKNTHYALRPALGMVAGEYTSPITVTYRDTHDNTHAVTATAHFTVLSQPTGGDDCKHTNLVKTEAKPATHLEAGNKEYWYCADCNQYFSDEAGTNEITLESTVIPKLTEHTVDDTGWHSDEANHWNICECGEVIDKEGHKFGEWTITKEATKTEAGSRTKSCSVCGYKVTESILATGTTEPTEPSKPTGPTNPTDLPKPTDPDKGNPDKGNIGPQTGDNSHLALWIALLLASGGTLTATTIYSRKRRKKNK